MSGPRPVWDAFNGEWGAQVQVRIPDDPQVDGYEVVVRCGRRWGRALIDGSDWAAFSAALRLATERALERS